MPILFLGMLVFQLDRINLASALTSGFAKDTNVDQDTINLGNQIMFLGIVLLEIPSNILLQRNGPRKWISAQVLVFGSIGAGFLISRMFLGLAEAGYILGAMYAVSTWYTNPLLASGISKLEGVRGTRGWQWLFLGLLTLTVSVIIFFLLLGSPETSKPLGSTGLARFTPREQGVLRKSLEVDDSEKKPGAQGMRIPLRIVGKTVDHYKRWLHFVSTFCVFSTWSFDRITANALTAVGASLALVVVLVFAYASDRTNQRVARSVHPHVGKWSCFGLWTAINSSAVGYHPIHNSWLQLNCKEPAERSISIAMWVMSAMLGLMMGTQYFRADDTPFYDKGLRTTIIRVLIGMAFAISQVLVYKVHNQRVVGGSHRVPDGEEPRIYTL
ncbi:inner membrane transporter yfaV [Xylariales sp. AK1849]|nr:inner membrane transporter yfaV [Xylariales sp. AK1849]